MQKIALYACVAFASSTLSFGTSSSAAPLPPQAGLASPSHLAVVLVRRGADDILKLKHRGRSGDDGPGHISHSASSTRHGADDAAGHQHHSGADDSGHHSGRDSGHDGDHGGGGHGGGDDHGGRR
jgi:hypothetical protein